ncbi:caspase family protein [Candidatus Puniceispirillum sp.]|nr:caspase family protein [Candidatus Puniceispirillum sp.]
MMTRVLLTFLVGLVVSLGALVSGVEPVLAYDRTGDVDVVNMQCPGFPNFTEKRLWTSNISIEASISLSTDESFSLTHYGMSTFMRWSGEYKGTKEAEFTKGLGSTSISVSYGKRFTTGAWTKRDYIKCVSDGFFSVISSQKEISLLNNEIPASDEDVCNMATYNKGWDKSSVGKSWREEAKRRSLSCGVDEASLSTQIASAPKAKPKVTSAALTAAEKPIQTIADILIANEYVKSRSDKYVCERTVFQRLNRWDYNTPFGSYTHKMLLEVQARGLDCGITNPDFKLNDVLNTIQKKGKRGPTTPNSLYSASSEQICGGATFKGSWDARSRYAPYLKEANRRGLNCGVVGTATSQIASTSDSNQPKAPTSAALLAAERKARELEQQLAALRAEKAKQQQTISSDTKLPTITIASASTKGKQGIIRGKARDNTGIAEVMVGGRPVPFDASGNFRFETFVPVGGKQVTIQVTDLNGLSNSKTVKLDRSASNTTIAITFESLNPLGRKVVKNEDALALIIGVDEYSKTPARAIYADSDAKVFADYANEKLGIPANRIKTLVNDGADESGMLLAVKDWLSRASKKDKSDVYVFFAGHGLASQDGEKMYLLPYDGSPRLLEKTAILRDELFSDIASANPRSVTVFLDTCYSGETRGNEMLIAGRPIGIRALKQSIPDNFTLMTAAAGDQIANPLKEAKHGMFSYFLMKGMEGLADTNQDNKITALELHEYVKENVWQQSSNKQLPELQGDENRVLVQFQ